MAPWSAARRALLAASTAALLLAFAAGAGEVAAQICGDVDGDGIVGVPDGVQVLREAAGLPSSCTPAVCDVDVDGVIGVVDAVTVLRKGAGLPITENCVASTGFIDRDVSELFERTQPLISSALKIVVENRDRIAPRTIRCDNAADDGEIDVDASEEDVSLSFSECRLDDTIFNGDISAAGRNPEIAALELTDRRGEESISFDGTVRGIDTESGVAFDGNLEASPTLSSEVSDFLLTLETVAISATGTITSGSLTFNLNNAGLEDVRSIMAFYDGSNLVRVVVAAEDLSTAEFLFDLITQRFV